MTPTPQKSPMNIGLHIANAINEVFPDSNIDYWQRYIAEFIKEERTAYNALLEKVQRIEAERDSLRLENGGLRHKLELFDKSMAENIELKKRLDSEYDRGLDHAIDRVESEPLNPRYGIRQSLVLAILKLRRV